jgi:hypothetical protein
VAFNLAPRAAGRQVRNVIRERVMTGMEYAGRHGTKSGDAIGRPKRTFDRGEVLREKFVGGAVREARCIDTARLSAVAGAPVRAAQKGNRPECACFEARDIGEYDTCPHGCVYCYAVRNRPLAQRRYAQHDPAGEFLFPPLNLPDNESGPDEPFQIVLFE